jgi:hypothetical protein
MSCTSKFHGSVIFVALNDYENKFYVNDLVTSQISF